MPDYPELQGESIKGQYCLYLIIPSSKGKASKGLLSLLDYPELKEGYCLYLIILSSKGKAFNVSIVST